MSQNLNKAKIHFSGPSNTLVTLISRQWFFKFLAIIFQLQLMNSCAHRVLIISEPAGARVSVVVENGRPGALLGNTPLDLKSLPNGDAIILEIEKEGHLAKQVVVPNMQGVNLTISTRLQPLTREFLAEKNRRVFAASLNDNIGQIFMLQAAILARKKETVVKLETEMREQWREVSFFHSLMGNYHYFIGEFNAARERYEKALSLDPDNAEARAMLLNINEMR